MTKEEAINILRETHDNSLFSVRTALETLIPELKESEDEKIRKDIINLIYWLKGNPSLCSQYYNDRYDDMLAYLEKQKEFVSEDFESIWKTEDCKTLLDEGEKLSPRFKEMFKEVCHSWYDKGIEVGEKKKESLKDFIDDFPYSDQKEQKPNFDTHWENGSMVCEQKEEKVEWSEEDEKTFWRLTAYIPNEELERLGITRTDILMKLKSLRLHPIQLKEAYKDGFQTSRYAIASAFRNYLDENRPDGKMCLSNGECEDIDKAFKGGDWAKIMRYYEKYRPHWKPSEEQLFKLSLIAAGVPDDDDAELLMEIYEQLVKLT